MMNAYVIDIKDFSPEFAKAIDTYHDNRLNSYQRVYIEDDITKEDYDADTFFVMTELIKKGLT